MLIKRDLFKGIRSLWGPLLVIKFIEQGMKTPLQVHPERIMGDKIHIIIDVTA